MDYDWVTLRLPTLPSDEARRRIGDWADTFKDGEWVKSVARLGPDLTVVAHRNGTLVSGSPHKHVLGESVGAFGPTELLAFAEDLAVTQGLPLGEVLAGRVSRFDLAANLIVEHDVAEYVRLMSAPPKTKPVGSGPRSLAYVNTVRQLLAYDKRAKLLDRGLGHLVPEAWRGRHALRFEVRFKQPRKEFGRDVTLALLCDRDFWEEAKGRWYRHFRSIPMRAGVWVPPPTPTVPALRDAYAEAGIEATGGPDAAIERIDANRRAGLVTPKQASKQRTWVRVSLEGGTARIVDSLAAELGKAAQAAVREADPARQRSPALAVWDSYQALTGSENG